MLVLHANWVRGRCLLWGETMPAPDAAPRREGGKTPRSPFDAGKWNLGAAVSALARSNYKARAAHARRVVAALPTFEGRPIPSRTSLLPLDWEEPPADAPAEHWEVTALPLSYPELATVLSLCARAENPYECISRRIAVGRDLLVLADIWRFAGAVAARQTVVPAIRGNRSRWVAVLDRADARRLDNICASMPPAASCLAGAEPPETYATGFFDDAVDLIVREAVTTPLSRVHAARGVFFDVHSAWLASLRSRNSEIRWKSQEDIAEFAADLEEWRHPVSAATASELRLGFRLSDPCRPGAATPLWRLTPVIVGGARAQPLSPESLAKLAPADRESLLLALGQASVICPLLTGGVAGGGDHVALDASEVGIFLRETAPVLKAAGFGVFTPSWWSPKRTHAEGGGEGDGTRIRIRAASARFPSEGNGFFSLDALVNVKWELVLGDERLTEADVEKILSGGQQLVRLRSRWIYADRARLSGALERLRELNAAPVSVRRLVHLSAGGPFSADASVELDLSRIERNGTFAAFAGQLRGKTGIEETPVPEGFSGVLRPYQRRGLSWLAFLSKWGFGACLADDMGLGKTIEAIALLLHTRGEGLRTPSLVICPMSIMTKWQREFARFAPGLKTWIFHGPGRPLGADFARAAGEADVVITSYQLLCRDFSSIGSVHWGVVTIDEAQNIKNADTRKSRAARKLPSDWRLALTGTPVENGVGDLWAIMDFLNPGLLPGRTRFNETFLRPIQMGTDSSARDALRRITGPFILRRLKTDPDIVSDLPPRVEEKVYCPLTAEQAELYAAEVRDLSKILSSSGSARRGNVLGLLTRLKQICNHPEHYFSREAPEETPVNADPLASVRSGKVRRLDEMLDDVLAAGECALVFTQYAVMGRLLQRHLRARLGCDIPFLYGGTKLRDRDTMIARFQQPDGPPVFIVSIKAGGTGLDLTRANHVFHFDRWWNPAVENQATDRAHRIGQTKTVFVHTFICEGTLESRIDDLITGKTELARQIVGSGDSWIAGLSDDTLREVLALSASATAYADDPE